MSDVLNEDLELVKKIREALEDKKSEDIRVLDIREITTIGDYFVIASGNNANQLQAMEDAVDEVMYKNGHHQKSVEGNRASSWILMDYGNIIVHIFSKEDRLFYDLDRIWKDGKEIEF
ncbi:MAG: ribosome silencing factor [Lachnospiraceae bacterium]|nr:ribosome silencing factor [Lachnospiraceae bacterium]